MAGCLAWVGFEATRGLPGRAAIAALGHMAEATRVFDAFDRPVFTIYREQRIEVPLDEIAPRLVDAVLAIEDRRFYEHAGVDPVRLVGAALANLRAGRFVQGGSTITQQLARQGLVGREKTLARKLREILLALRIERLYSKTEILELYLNKVYFGDGLYGVEAAARGYFGRPAAELDLAQAALLAGLIKAPATYSPTADPDRAVERRAVVLRAMREQGTIDGAEQEAARAAPLALESGLGRGDRFAQYFKEQVRQELVERFGWERVYEEGLRVYTTIDPAIQAAAESAVEHALQRIEARPGYRHPRRRDAPATHAGQASPYLQAALVALDPSSGHVRALVGGRDFTDSRFNRATQARRQAGSAFKPFVFAAALEAGFTPATLLENLDEPVDTPQGPWLPVDDHVVAGSMTVRTALRVSSNRAAVRLLRAVGIERAVGAARQLGLGSPPAVPSLVLGAGEVTLQAMTSAYAVFASGGVLRPAVFVRRVESRDGETLFEAPPAEARVISETTAFLMADLLADVLNTGTGSRVRREGFVLPAGGKTGTTNDYLDAWFVGFTPTLATGVWIGFDRPRPIVPNGYASDLAAPLWAAVMKAATGDRPPVWLEPPAGLVLADVCRLSGLRPAAGCYRVPLIAADGRVEEGSAVFGEFFAAGTEPGSVCPVHGGRPFLERLTGRLDRPAPVEARQIGSVTLAEAPTATSGGHRAADDEARPEARQRKRGFWARLFGKR